MRPFFFVILFALVVGLFSIFPERKMGASSFVEIPAVVETKIGERYFLAFKDSQGKVTTTTITQQEYLNLGKKDAINPIQTGKTLIGAFTQPIIVTSSPVLLDSQYFVVGVDVTSSTLVKVKKNGVESVIKKSDLTTF